MELEQLRIFVAVAETGSFTKGAKRLYISHSSTSRAVSALEEEFGLRLIDRSNHVTCLTPAGEVLFNEAKELLAFAETIKKRVLAETAVDER